MRVHNQLEIQSFSHSSLCLVRALFNQLTLRARSYLGMEKGCFVLKDKNGSEERYLLFEKPINEVVLRSGNMISTGALASLGFWDVDVMVMTQKGKPRAHTNRKT